MNKIMPIHLLLLSGLSLHFISCQSPPPAPLDFTQVQWENYTSPALDYSLSIPHAYTLNEYADGYFTIFRHKGSPAVRVNFTDAAEGKKRGLWFGHEAASEIELGGRKGFKYIYDHYTMAHSPVALKPTSSPTVANISAWNFAPTSI
jgi:hypothetical protein